MCAHVFVCVCAGVGWAGDGGLGRVCVCLCVCLCVGWGGDEGLGRVCVCDVLICH